MAPLVVRDRVIVGNAGGEMGVRGWVKGLDLNSGAIIWTGYSIGPDAEVLASPATFKPFYQKDQELALTESSRADFFRDVDDYVRKVVVSPSAL